MAITIEPAGNASFVYRCLQTTLMVNTVGNHTLASCVKNARNKNNSYRVRTCCSCRYTHIDQSQSALHFAGMRAFHTLNKKTK